MRTCKYGAAIIALICSYMFLVGCGSNGNSIAAAPRTVTVTTINTYWDPDGATEIPTTAGPIVFPQQDGTYTAIQPTQADSSTFVYDNVPEGYFWLILPGETQAPTPPASSALAGPTQSWYWTSSSNIDAGSDMIGPPFVRQNTPAPTYFSLDLSGLDATSEPSRIQALSYPAGVFGNTFVQNSSTYSGMTGAEIGSDVTAIHYAVITQNEPALVGPYQGYVLGPALTLTNLSLSNGITNPISGTLLPSPQASQALKIDGSRWNGLFDNVAPSAPTLLGSPLRLEAQPFLPQGKLASASAQISQGLFWLSDVSQYPFIFATPSPLPGGVCRSGLTVRSTYSPLSPPVIQTDIDMGAISYGDPFPAEWQRVFSFCQQATVNLPSLSSTQTPIYVLSNWQKSGPPTAEVKPIVSPVVNPVINGASLFSEATVKTKAIRLSWSKPAIGTPIGYRVGVITTQTIAPPGLPPIQFYYQPYTLSTAATSVTIPPQLLTAGDTYLFTITAVVDGAANMETRPLRSSLPVAGADVISAPILVSASAR